MPAPLPLAPGVLLWKGWLDRAAQEAVLGDVMGVLAAAPLFMPRMPRTADPMSVRMTNCGDLGWISDVAGYRYQRTHPVSGKAWPPMPRSVLAIWDQTAAYPCPPEACLVNFYDSTARMGLHQDRDELDFNAPIVSISLGDGCKFRMGGTIRGGATRSLRLESGDVLVFGGAARRMYHGVDRIFAGSSSLLPSGGRINLTLRRVSAASDHGSSGESQ